MHRRALALFALVAALGLAGAAPAQTGAPAAPTRIYGLELERASDRDRLLVFAEGELEPRMEPAGPGRLVVVLPRSALDPSAPTQLEPRLAGAVARVRVREQVIEGVPAVFLEIEHEPDAAPALSRRGAIVAVELTRPRAPRGARFAIHFEDAELADVVAAVADATGERFVFDDRLQGRVTIGIFDRIGPHEMLEVLFAALRVQGFVAVPAPGGAWKVLPLPQGAAQAPWRGEAPEGGSEAPVVALIRLHAADPGSIAESLRPWLSEENVAVALPGVRGVLVAGPERKLRDWLALARALDAAAEEELVVVRARHRSARELAQLVHARFRARAGARPELGVSADARTGSVVLRGAPDAVAEARALLGRLDRAWEGDGAVQAHAIRHVDPERLEAVVRAALAGATAPPAPGVAALPRAATALAGEPVQLALHRPTRKLLVQASPRGQALVADLLAALDRPVPQVAVEATVLEVSASDALRLGVDAFVPLTSPDAAGDPIASALSNPSGGGLLQPGAGQGVAGAARITRAPLVIPMVDALGNPTDLLVPRESVVLAADDRRVAARVLMRPHVVVANGEEQEIFAGDEVPIPTSAEATGGAAASPLQITTRIERQDVGVRLRVRPTLGEAGGVVLAVTLEQTALGPSLAGDVAQVGPTLLERRVGTTVHLTDGQVVVLAMAPRHDRLERESGVPFLRRVPVLGVLFRATREESVRSQLVVALQASIVRSPEGLLGETLARRIGFAREQARARSAAGETGYAVLLATVQGAPEAQARAERARRDGAGRVRVIPWSDASGVAHHDVVVTGFERYVQAARAANAWRARGWSPRVIVLDPAPRA